MKDNFKMRKENPYLLYYFSFAIVCCVTLSVIFLFINYQNVKRTEDNYNQEKLELVCEMLDAHLESQRGITYLISKWKEYQPYYFRQNKYYELEMLEDFNARDVSLALEGMAFLYYDGDEVIFRNDGRSQSLKQYFNFNEYNEAECEVIATALQEVWKGIRVYSIADSLYFMSSIKVTESIGNSNAVYCFVVQQDDLEERIQVVSGGLKGNYAIYVDDQVVYSNSENPCSVTRAGVISAATQNGQMQICWLPEGIMFPGHMLPLQILLLLSVLLMIFVFASYFAWKSFLPIKGMAEKYRESVSGMDEQEYKNILEELNYMMDAVLKSNMEINEQLAQKQILLKKQILRMILNGNYSFDTTSNANHTRILFPGSYFFVMSILLGEETVEQDFLYTLAEQLELLNDFLQEKHVAVLCEAPQKAVYVLCSMDEEEQYEELKESVQEVVDSFERNLRVGCGKVYSDLSKGSASYLESLDNVHKYAAAQKSPQTENTELIYSKSDIYRICSEMALGNEEGVIRAINSYVERLRSSNVSLLMQQYIFSNFISEVSKTAFDNQIELEQSSVSLLVSARNLNSFLEAAGVLVHDFCTKLKDKQEQIAHDEAYQVCAYMRQHFADYDLSMEKVAADLGTTTAFVRKAVKEKTGNSYKDFLIYLRIEYAKELLEKGKLTVAEVCERVGYGNISYFIKVFRETTGMTPAVWREQQPWAQE